MSIAISIIIILIIAFVVIYNLQKKRIKELKKQIDFIYENKTNMEITTGSLDKDIIEISKSINKIIRQNKDSERKLRKIQNSMKETLVSISHDLRTPLTSISGYLQLLEKNQLTEEKRLAYIKIINGRVLVVQKMLDLLFEFIRLENNDISLDIQKIKVDDILRDSIVIYYYDFMEKNKDEEPIILIPEKSIEINADKNALGRVFNNIIYNSLIHGDGAYKIELKEYEYEVEISFSNHTSSIEYSDIKMVFERFFTADKSKNRKTTGLGLSIAKLLVEKMNGKISSSMENEIFEIKIKLKK